jgi:hypothetical protein
MNRLGHRGKSHTLVNHSPRIKDTMPGNGCVNTKIRRQSNSGAHWLAIQIFGGFHRSNSSDICRGCRISAGGRLNNSSEF